MITGLHERARRLAAISRLEDLAEPDRLWLQEHLAQCAPCESLVQRLADGLAALRLDDVRVEPWLVGLTQRRLRARLAEHEGPTATLVAAAAVGFTSATAVAWALWLLFQGLVPGLPLAVRVTLAVALWFLPVTSLALPAVVLRLRHERESAVSLPEVG
jgi:hypothetical protein